MSKEYLNEERYQKARKKIIVAGVIVILTGLLIGGALIAKGFVNKVNGDTQYTEENKQKKIDDLNAQYAVLENSIQPQLDEIRKLTLEKNGDLYFKDEDRYYAIEGEIATIKEEIKPIQTKMRNLELDIRSAELQNVEFERKFNSSQYVPFFMIGGFIIMVGFMIGGAIIAQAYRRNMLAYGVQSGMPVAKEGIDEMLPYIGKVAKEIKNGFNEDEESD